MEAVVFIGIQATGKSEFYKRSFLKTHIRLNMDMLKTRHRENILLQACIAAKQPFVIDNTNPTAEDRKKYILPAHEAGFRIKGFYFASRIKDAMTRNEQRSDSEKIPAVGIAGTYKKLELPRYEEGFDELRYVRIAPDFEFVVEEYKFEI